MKNYTSQVYEIIKELVQKYDEKAQVKHLCEIAKVSRSGYYNYFSEKSIENRNKKENQDEKDRDIILDAFVHSDQGSHYTSPTFQSLLKELKLGQSMSRKGNCWDNAPQESFFGHMKDEVDFKACSTFEELQVEFDKYIEYYNNYRYQWNLKKMSPVQYRNHLLQNQ